MASKIKSVYVCSECGYESAKWYGCCPECREWNTISEEVRESSPKKSVLAVKSGGTVIRMNEVNEGSEHRFSTGLSELNRVLGGGIVKGSLVLLSGDPGIGKSTILLQICQYLGKTLKVLYVSGEESAHQIKLRAKRLCVTTDNLFLMCETDIELVMHQINNQKPDIVIADSVQTMHYAELASTSGSISQVRECTNLLFKTAKTLDIPIILVGHVNKDGNIAGPKALEHIVDTVLYFEGDRNMSYRILRAVKNRYGSTNEIGVFEMLDTGLSQVENPSLMLLAGRPKNASGTCVACTMEGSRPIFAEVQGLASPSNFGNPRRMSTGFDNNRMAMILAILEKRAGYFFGNMDTYINVVGGLKLDEPAADLSVALALVSSLKDSVVREDVLAFGEIGLAGEIRGVSHCEQRINEAARLGFKRCVISQQNVKGLSASVKKSIEIIGVKNIREAFEAVN